jgi:hypothetical protein
MAQDSSSKVSVSRTVRISAATVAPYQRIPFKDGGRDHRGADCWGLIWLIYKEVLGIELCSYGWIGASELRAVLKRIDTDRDIPPWKQVENGTEAPYDVIVMSGGMQSERGLVTRPVHVGMVFQPGVLLHTEANSGPTIQAYKDTPQFGRASLLMKNRVLSIHRHESRL